VNWEGSLFFIFQYLSFKIKISFAHYIPHDLFCLEKNCFKFFYKIIIQKICPLAY